MRARALLLTLALVFLGARAQGEPRYVADGDEIFWVLYASDFHIGADLLGSHEEDRLATFIADVARTIGPHVLLGGGDLTEGAALFGQSAAQWGRYEEVCSVSGADASWFFDVPGNHDAWSDGPKEHFRTYGIQGQATGSAYYDRRMVLPWGEYHLVGIDTSQDNGGIWPTDSSGQSAAELLWLDSQLDANSNTRLSFVFGHHPLGSFRNGRNEIEALFHDYDVALYFSGHIHSREVDWYGRTLLLTTDSLGKGTENELALVGVDHDGLSARILTMHEWPAVLITAPLHAGLGGGHNRLYPVHAGTPDNFVRALVFSPNPVFEVQVSIDDGNWVEMTPVTGVVYQAAWDTTNLAPGDHFVEVRAVSGEVRSHRIRVVLAEPLPEPEPQPEAADVASPEIGQPDVAQPDAFEPDMAEPAETIDDVGLPDAAPPVDLAGADQPTLPDEGPTPPDMGGPDNASGPDLTDPKHDLASLDSPGNVELPLLDTDDTHGAESGSREHLTGGGCNGAPGSGAPLEILVFVAIVGLHRLTRIGPRGTRTDAC